MFRTANGLWVVVYLWSAFVQLNDPDPLVWTLIYVAAAVPCAAWVVGRSAGRALPAGVAIAAVLYGIVVGATSGGLGAPMDHGPGGVLAFEVVREGLGLGLIVAWMAVLVWKGAPAEA